MQYQVVLIGATGLIGKQCLQDFLEDADCSEVTVIARRSVNIANLKLKELIINFDDLGALKLNDAEGKVFVSALGTTIKQAKTPENFKKVDFEYNMEFAKLAKQSNAAKYILISSLGAEAASSNFYLQTKGLLENEIKKLSFPIAYILRPSMLLGPRTEFRFGELIGKYAMQLLGFMFIGPLLKYKAIHITKISNAVRHFAKTVSENGFHIVESDELQKF